DTKITVENATPATGTDRQVQAAPTIGSSDKRDLGTLKADNGWASEIWGLSATGSVAVGDSYADGQGPNMRAAAWSGAALSQKQDLGTLRGDNTGAAKAYAVSKDG
ncbi:hypothetical protein ACLBXB_29175, partial [Methylobacterium mesophilicum]